MISEPMARVLRLLLIQTRSDGLASVGAAGADALGVDALAVSLLTGAGHTELLWCSDDTSRRFEDLQFTLGEGPGHDAVTSGRTVWVPDLARTRPDRWAALNSELLGLPVGAVFCFPLGIGAIGVGVLTALRRAPGPLTDEQADDALILASALTARYLGGSQDQAAAPPPADIPFTLQRAVVHQATGMVSVQLDLPLPQALLRLRAHAYSSGRPISDISQDIVERRLRLHPNDNATPPPGGEKD